MVIPPPLPPTFSSFPSVSTKKKYEGRGRGVGKEESGRCGVRACMTERERERESLCVSVYVGAERGGGGGGGGVMFVSNCVGEVSVEGVGGGCVLSDVCEWDRRGDRWVELSVL